MAGQQPIDSFPVLQPRAMGIWELRFRRKGTVKCKRRPSNRPCAGQPHGTWRPCVKRPADACVATAAPEIECPAGTGDSPRILVFCLAASPHRHRQELQSAFPPNCPVIVADCSECQPV